MSLSLPGGPGQPLDSLVTEQSVQICISERPLWPQEDEKQFLMEKVKSTGKEPTLGTRSKITS